MRSSVGQRRLNFLALLCIENELLKRIDAHDIIKSFALANPENASFECVQLCIQSKNFVYAFALYFNWGQFLLQQIE